MSATARRGVTLVELLVVLAVIGILAGLCFVLFSAGQQAADGLQTRTKAAVAAHEKHQQQLAARGAPKAAGKKIPNLSTPGRPIGGVIPDQYIVRFQNAVNPFQVAQQLAQQDASVQILHVYHQVYKGAALRASAAAIAQIKQAPFVTAVEQDRLYGICQEVVPTGVERLSVSRSQIQTPFVLGVPGISSGSGIRNIRTAPGSASGLAVAIIDSGIDSSHPDLFVMQSVGFGANNPNGEDQNGHGTHVSGIVGAIHNTIGVRGVFPGVALWSVRVFDATGTGPSSDIIAGINYVAQNAGKIQVANLSLGGPFLQALNDALDAMVQQGVVAVVAAGNSSVDASTFSPASAPSAITVAAMCDSDGFPGGKGPVTPAGPDDTFASFSNFGKTVSIIAPGVNILSTFPGATYQMLSGTSQATPHVSGLCALIIADHNTSHSLGPPRNVRVKNSAQLVGAAGIPLSPAQVRSLLLQLPQEHIPGIFDAIQYPLATGLP